MAKRDPRIDTYIRGEAAFAKPILNYLRKLVHQTCPEVEETIKWGMPHFMYRGKILCGMGAFKAHCTFGFWKGSLIALKGGADAKAAMGQLGRITSLKDLPSKKALQDAIRQAMKLNEPGAKAVKRPVKHKKRPLRAPADLQRALRSNARAQATFREFSPSHQREYIEWILDAKTEETRERRLETAIEWMAAGKSRNWKYKK